MAIVQHLKLTEGVSKINSAYRFYNSNQPRVLTFSADYNTAVSLTRWLNPIGLKVYLHWKKQDWC